MPNSATGMPKRPRRLDRWSATIQVPIPESDTGAGLHVSMLITTVLSRVSYRLARGMLGRGMQVPLTVTFRNMPPSAAIEADIREKAAKLEEFYDRITSARVVVETPHRQHRQGRLFHVRIDLRVPGRELVVSREPAAHHAYEDVYVAIRDTFDAAKRQLEDYVRELRGDVKTHEPPPQGRVVRLHAENGYGFIATPDGHEVYFHRNSVVDGDFDRLAIGDEVRFSEEAGERGPQASTVHVAGVPFTRKTRRGVRT